MATTSDQWRLQGANIGDGYVAKTLLVLAEAACQTGIHMLEAEVGEEEEASEPPVKLEAEVAETEVDGRRRTKISTTPSTTVAANIRPMTTIIY